MSKYTERVENLIRVVEAVPNDKFCLRRWCDCAMGHAIRDEYFVARNFKPDLTQWGDIAKFFDISMEKVKAIILYYPGNETKSDVLAKLRVLLLEKMAQEIGAEVFTEPASNAL